MPFPGIVHTVTVTGTYLDSGTSSPLSETITFTPNVDALTSAEAKVMLVRGSVTATLDADGKLSALLIDTGTATGYVPLFGNKLT